MMKRRKISKKKVLQEKTFKLTSVLLIANLVLGGFFINAPKAWADTTTNYLTTSGFDASNGTPQCIYSSRCH